MSKTKTFAEHYQPAYSAVPVLKWMNRLESVVKVNYIFECMEFTSVILFQ